MRARLQRSMGIGLLALTLVVAGCKSSSSKTALTVTGAKTALTFGDITSGAVQAINRPSATLGLFINLYLANGGSFVRSLSAMQGVAAEAVMHGKPTAENQQNTYDLLEEFGTVLQVDIVDVLNRSQDRSGTLNDYMQGLANITERSKRKSTELLAYIDQLQDERTAKRTGVSALDKATRDALNAKDYATAAEQQPKLADAQADLARTEADLKQQQSIQNAFKQLLDVSARRTQAIQENREIMVAGLKVVNVPGAESLGILENVKNSGRTSTGLGSFGL